MVKRARRIVPFLAYLLEKGELLRLVRRGRQPNWRRKKTLTVGCPHFIVSLPGISALGIQYPSARGFTAERCRVKFENQPFIPGHLQTPRETSVHPNSDPPLIRSTLRLSKHSLLLYSLHTEFSQKTPLLCGNMAYTTSWRKLPQFRPTTVPSFPQSTPVSHIPRYQI